MILEIEDNTVTLPEILEIAEAQGVRLVTPPGHDTVFVEYRNTIFQVWDNGGEIGVEKVNSGDLPRFAPLTYFERVCTAWTMTYRLLAILRGAEIDFGFKIQKEG